MAVRADVLQRYTSTITLIKHNLKETTVERGSRYKQAKQGDLRNRWYIHKLFKS